MKNMSIVLFLAYALLSMGMALAVLKNKERLDHTLKERFFSFLSCTLPVMYSRSYCTPVIATIMIIAAPRSHLHSVRLLRVD